MAFLLSFFFLTYVVDFCTYTRPNWRNLACASDQRLLFTFPPSLPPGPAKKYAKKGLTEKGDMVYDPARAAEYGEADRPTAPAAIARDMGPNHSAQAYNTMTSTEANTEAPSLHQQPMREVENERRGA